MTKARQNARRDAWWTPLRDDEQWEIFERSRGMSWSKAVAVAEEVCGRAPTRSAWYRFIRYMMPRAAAHRLEQVAQARVEAQGLAGQSSQASETAMAFLALATEIAMHSGSASEAEAWTAQAARLFAAAQRDTELKLRADAQALNREKFEAAEKRLAAVEEAAREKPGEQLTPEERIEKIRAIFGISPKAEGPEV